MSKVYKAFSVIIESPLLIEHSLEPDVDDLSGAADAGADEPEIDDLGGLEPQAYLAQVRVQADEILQETEDMVKDLLQTARQEAEKIIMTANEEAAGIVTKGREQAAQIQQEAQQQGWQDGFNQGAQVAAAEYSGKLAEAENIVKKAHLERQELIAGSEEEIVQLAMAVARKVICTELKINPEAIIEIVKRALLKVSDREMVTVRVNTDDLDIAISAQEQISQSVQGIKKFKVLADTGVSQGGCVVETPNGNVDARIERQLSEMEQAVMEVGSNV